MTSEPNIADVIAGLEQAFRRLECPDTDALRGTINILAALSVVQPSPRARYVGRREARQELNDLANALELPIRRIEALSRTAARTLGGRQAIAMPRQLRRYVEAVRTAEIVEATERGRPKNTRAIRAARIIVNAFEAATLCRVDLPADGRANSEKPKLLEPLIRDVFKVIGIRASPRAMINAAIAVRQQSKRKHASAFREPAERHAVTAEQFFERMKQIDAVERQPLDYSAAATDALTSPAQRFRA